MNDKKILGVSTIAVIALILIAVAATYAFFKATEAGDGDTPLQVTTNTVDSLIFNVDTDITMVADMSNFTEGKGNREGVSNATATLKANNKTNNATGNYYLYFDIKENELTYTTEDNTAELLLQVSGPDGELGDGDIANLNYVTVTDGKGESISGFDITEVQDLINIVSNKSITTTSEKVDDWEIKVILVNLSTDQNSNGGKKFSGEIIIQKEPKSIILSNYIKSLYKGTQGKNNIYYHDENLANGAGDGSYRYAGSYEDVNNYVCFGYNGKDTCPWNNTYRIIGVFNNQVKLIKADFLGIINSDDVVIKENLNTSAEHLAKYRGKLSTVPTYYWSGSNLNVSNVWANSTINTIALNDNFLNSFNNSWQNKINIHDWIVGGVYDGFMYASKPKDVFSAEITSPSSTQTIENSKIGLMYASDYFYGALPLHWTKVGYSDSNDDYRTAVNENWMYIGIDEWIITRSLSHTYSAGAIFNCSAYPDTLFVAGHGIRPCFYLDSDILFSGGTGTESDPYKIV